MDEPIVEYRIHADYLGYRFGCDGTIWTCLRATGPPARMFICSDTWRELTPDRRLSDGRKRYTLRHSSGKYRRRYGYYFIALVFIGVCPPGMEVCHDDGVCTNDAVSNIRYDTKVANEADKKRHGTNLQGERMALAKLTVADGLEIREAGYPLRPHAVKHKVSEALISLILRRKVWKHV